MTFRKRMVSGSQHLKNQDNFTLLQPSKGKAILTAERYQVHTQNC